MRGEIYLRQERWRESHDELVANAPDFLESLWARFNESAINYLYMLGRSAEGIEEWEKARRLLCRCPLCTYPSRGRSGRIGTRLSSNSSKGRLLIRLRSFSRTPKLNTGFEKMLDREKIRQKFIANRLNKKATDFRLETLEGETYTLSAMRGKGYSA